MLGTQLEYAVTIQDNEEEEQIVFAMKDSEIVVGEDATYAEITIQRLSGPDYYAGAVYQTVAGTAQPLESYEPVDNGQITFEPGETEKTVQIPLVGEIDARTYFTVQLSSESNFTQEGQESVVVWLGEKYPGDLSLINPQFPSVSLRSPHPLQHPTFRL